MKIIWCEIRDVGKVFQNFPSETLFQITCNRGRTRSSVVNRAPFESSPGCFCEMPCASGSPWYNNWQHSRSLHAYGNQPAASSGGPKRLRP
ncbi:hypothetical protein AVEN_151366-1 [Araneus ventricosus]|uniref:Uncharacterized protein n=1 Tax=Araneus ventricosus TaxID=182803 RepID=A0A4Y2CA37_ARAVE|nr:hypothetical protein AVEN_151366-1 [Araneus ventricosus]